MRVGEERMRRVSRMPRLKSVIVAVAGLGIVLVGALGLLLGYRLITGRGLGFGLWRVKHLGLALLDSRSVIATSEGGRLVAIGVVSEVGLD